MEVTAPGWTCGTDSCWAASWAPLLPGASLTVTAVLDMSTASRPLRPGFMLETSQFGPPEARPRDNFVLAPTFAMP
jgi:hypothetical protein